MCRLRDFFNQHFVYINTVKRRVEKLIIIIIIIIIIMTLFGGSKGEDLVNMSSSVTVANRCVFNRFLN